MIALTLVGLVLALIPVSGPVRTAVLLPLVLIAPGYALAAALFLPGEINRDLRVVLTVAFSVSASALGGLLLQLVLSLDRPAFAALLAAITTLAVVVALVRREAIPIGGDHSNPRLPRVSAVSVVAMLAAVAIVGLAFAIATAGAHRQLDKSHFSSLWIVPQGPPGVPRRGPPMKIGVSNREGRPASYRLIVQRGTKTVRQWRFRLGTNQDWLATLAASTISGTGPLVGHLYRDGTPYRRVVLEIGVSS